MLLTLLAPLGLLLSPHSATAQDDGTVAVLLGGTDLPLGWSTTGDGIDDINNFLVSGEIFGCPDGDNVAAVPDLPMRLDFARAVYWPEKEGVLLCGGVNIELYFEQEAVGAAAKENVLRMLKGDKGAREALRAQPGELVKDACYLWQPSVDPYNWVPATPMTYGRLDALTGLRDGNPYMLGGGDEYYYRADMETLEGDNSLWFCK